MKIIVECKDKEGNIYGMKMVIDERDAESPFFDELLESVTEKYGDNFRWKLGYDPIDLQCRVDYTEHDAGYKEKK